MVAPIGVGVILNVATGVFSNTIYDVLKRYPTKDEEKRFKKIVENILEKYKIEINKEDVETLFTSLILGKREILLKKQLKNIS